MLKTQTVFCTLQLCFWGRKASMASSNDLKRQLTILNNLAGSDIRLLELGKACVNRNIR